MADTVINNPASFPVAGQEDRGTGAGILVALLLLALILVAALVLLYGGTRRSATPQVSIPGKIDVNINAPGNTGK